MKLNRLKTFIVFAVLTLQVFASKGQSDVIYQVRETIKAGSSKELSKYLFQTVDVTIEGKVQSYSKAQAEFIFRDFFRQHPPSAAFRHMPGSLDPAVLCAAPHNRDRRACW